MQARTIEGGSHGNYRSFRISFAPPAIPEYIKGHQEVDNNSGGADHKPASRSWRKSNWSTYNGNCVELAMLERDVRGLRDSYNPGTTITVSPKALKKLLKSIKKGKFS